MSDTSVTLFRRMETLGLRRLAALYLLAFLAAVTTTPHRHLNSIEDLLSDGPSDSGDFSGESASPYPTVAPQWSRSRLADDDPCLACFHHDFHSTTETIAFFVLSPRFSPVSIIPPGHDPEAPPADARPSRSRAPPAFA
jgi:hypothetical protein